jgi:hypothetical protein
MKNLNKIGIVALLTAALIMYLPGCTKDPLAIAIGTIQIVVPVGVQYAASKDRNCVPYLVAAANTLDLAAGQGTVKPEDIIAALDASSASALKTPLAHSAIMAGIGIYTTFFYTDVQNNEKATRVIRAVASAIRSGLPPNDPAAKLRAKTGRHE